MKVPPLLPCVALAAAGILLCGCSSASKKEEEQIVTPKGTLPDQSADTSFRAFVGRLRKAASQRDVGMLANMMSADFGFSWEPGGEGPGVFDYWDKHRLWRQVASTLNEPFVLSGDYMVAPPAAATDPDYKGYRAGLRIVNGSWRFAYFVPTSPQ